MVFLSGLYYLSPCNKSAKPNCEKFREAFCYQGPKNWNMLPWDLKHVDNICLFKRMTVETIYPQQAVSIQSMCNFFYYLNASKIISNIYLLQTLIFIFFSVLY